MLQQDARGGGVSPSKDEGDRRGESRPVVGFSGQLFAAGARELVVLGLAVVVGGDPLAGSSRGARAGAARDRATLAGSAASRRHLVDALGDRPAMLRPERERLEDQEIERPLGRSSWSSATRSPFALLQDVRSLVEVQGEAGGNE